MMLAEQPKVIHKGALHHNHVTTVQSTAVNTQGQAYSTNALTTVKSPRRKRYLVVVVKATFNTLPPRPHPQRNARYTRASACRVTYKSIILPELPLKQLRRAKPTHTQNLKYL